ncbi:M23 family metallopeptidase [Brumimicrobium aurantiacum]|uniref:M23 family peptidase n=1 Tax=Brumimicrobium aurantiacum TaxID=1737063 RepID=A0A3E1EV31_9FLAO|nr:M23 family metallopeptidase [Brumimicrobium aurantiacum]RFC53424.1 M23 family peptidase [Brumimicrobium aurantiacum]
MKSPERKKKKNWFKRSTRIVGMDPVTFEEDWRVVINRVQFISISVLVVIVLFFINFLIFSFTPLGYLLPENIKNRNKEKIEATAIRVNELEKIVINQENYISNLQQVILGNVSIDSIYTKNNEGKIDQSEVVITDTSISKVEKELDQNLKESVAKQTSKNVKLFDQLFLYDPVSGTISSKYRIPNHPGVDIVTKKDEQIKACLDGIVLHASYNDEDGHTIILSHENEIISVYKHAQKSFVKVGEKVKRGKAIGIVGNTGKRTTGPHLHFELWSDNGPLDPLNYFSFGQ